jgi:hypothetical protein
LAWITTRLREGRTAGLTALGGIGGIGKMALAAVVVHQLHAEGSFRDAIAVVRCKELRQADAVLRALLARLDPQRPPPAEIDATALATIAANLVAGRDILVVLDNVEPELSAADLEAIMRSCAAPEPLCC